MATRKTARGTAAAVKAKPDEWGVRGAPGAGPEATFKSRPEAERYLRGEHAADSNVIVHLEGGGWVDVAPHKMAIDRYDYAGAAEGMVRCESQGCRYARLVSSGQDDPDDAIHDFRLFHLEAEPGDVASAKAVEALGEAVKLLGELEGLSKRVREGLLDREKRLSEADWWDDHSQGLSRTARQIEARLQVFLALERVAYDEQVIAAGRDG